MNSGEDEATRRYIEELTEYVFRYLQRTEQNDPEPDTEDGIRERAANLVNYALEKWNAGERVHRGGTIVLRGALNIQSEEAGAVVDWIYDAVDRDLASHRMTWDADCLP